MSYVKGLKCRECHRAYPVEPIYVCEFCFGSLEVDYDYDKIKKDVSREKIKAGPSSTKARPWGRGNKSCFWGGWKR